MVNAELFSILVVLVDILFNIADFFAVFQHKGTCERIHLSRRRGSHVVSGVPVGNSAR